MATDDEIRDWLHQQLKIKQRLKLPKAVQYTAGELQRMDRTLAGVELRDSSTYREHIEFRGERYVVWPKFLPSKASFRAIGTISSKGRWFYPTDISFPDIKPWIAFILESMVGRPAYCNEMRSFLTRDFTSFFPIINLTRKGWYYGLRCDLDPSWMALVAEVVKKEFGI